MRLLVLCADGIDPDYAAKIGAPKMPYEAKLTIPRELYWEDISPLTHYIFPAIFTGRIVHRQPTNAHARAVRQRLENLASSLGQEWVIKRVNKILSRHRARVREHAIAHARARTTWGILAIHTDLKTIFDEYDSLTWNIPTICPEWIHQFPSIEKFLQYSIREFKIWMMVSEAMSRWSYQLSASYCHLPDALGHLKKPLDTCYLEVGYLAKRLSESDHCAVMLLSDHGCLNGRHTNKAYLGCTHPIQATNVLEIKADMQRILESTRTRNSL